MHSISFSVAAFDFDHTLTISDSFLPFVQYVFGRTVTYRRLIRLLPLFIGFGLHVVTRQKVKEALITNFFKGYLYADLEKLGQTYADQCLDQYIAPHALGRLRWHQSQGHRCVLISASPDIYLKAWAQRMGFETVLASRLATTVDGHVTGRLLGKNCWGAEKVQRLLAYLGPKENYQLYAYGDSRGDRELLALADYPFYRSFQ